MDPRASLWRNALDRLFVKPRTEDIRALAYAKYVQRAADKGGPLVDWLEAEAELTGRTSD